MAKRLSDYLHRDEPRKLALFQVRVEKDLLESANRLRRRHGLKWRDIVEAGLKQFTDEMK